MNNKGFTLVELLAVITILAVIMGVAMVSYEGVFDKVDDSYYHAMESSMVIAGDLYFAEHKNLLPREGTKKVSVNELVSGNYMNELKTSKGKTCERADVFVEVKNGKYHYTACLKCGKYQSSDAICK